MVDEPKEQLLERIETEAAQMQRSLHYCARCVLLALVRNLELADDDCLELACKTGIPLSAGIAGTRNQCGALIGGVMAIGVGLVNHDARTMTPDMPSPAMAAAKRFYRWFEREFGQADCYDLREIHLGRYFDMADPEETKKFEAAGGYELCAGLVGKAARRAAEIILETRETSES